MHNTPQVMRGVCFYACACSARRENAGTLVRSAFLHGNYRSLVHFHSAGAACAAFLFARQFVQHPANNAGCLFLCLTDLGSVEPPPSLRAFLPRDGKTQTRPARQSELCRLSYAWLFLLPHKKIKDFLAGTPFTSPKMRDLRYIPFESLFLAPT